MEHNCQICNSSINLPGPAKKAKESKDILPEVVGIPAPAGNDIIIKRNLLLLGCPSVSACTDCTKIISKILEKIFDHLGFSDLKTSRLVCSTWNDVILNSRLNKMSEVHLEGLSLEKFIHKLKEQANPDVPDGGAGTMGVGFENYDLKVNTDLSTDPNMQILWDQVGHKIKSLKLEITTLYANRKLREILLDETDSLQDVNIRVTKYCGNETEDFEEVTKDKPEEVVKVVRPNPNLKGFSYSYLEAMSLHGFENRNRDGVNYKFPMCWSEFFTRFPNLQKLSLIGLFEIELTEMLEVLKELHKKHRKVLPDLRILEILDENVYSEGPNNDHLQMLIELNPSLTELHLEVSPVLRTPVFNTILTTLSSTLEVLRLRRYIQPYNFDERIRLTVPMVGVTFLEISNRLVASMAFLQCFPNLKTLHVILRDSRCLLTCDIIQNTPKTVEPHYNLQNIYIETPLVAPSCISKLANLAPNLTSLKIRMNNEMLWTLYGSPIANGLRDLHIISWGGLTDEGFTGIPLIRDCNLKEGDVGSDGVNPNIRSLKNLQSLTVEMKPDHSNSLTDTAVEYGFVNLVCLKEFKAIRTSITARAMKLMNFATCTYES